MSNLVRERFGLSEFDSPKVELRSPWTEDDLQKVFRAAYQQIFGRISVYAKDQFINAESLLRNGKITVRQFIQTLAKSEFYRECFFHNNSQGRFIELNYKHLLGRAPYDQSEIAYHVDLYVTQGYDADIDSYIYSEEYDRAFGDSVVPYYRGFSSLPGQKTVGYNRFFRLYRGDGNSDNAQFGGKGARLRTNLSMNLANSISPPTGAIESADFRGGTLANPSARSDNRMFKIEVVQGPVGKTAPIRFSKQVYTVAYDQLSTKYQEIHKRGGRIVNIAAV
ncbi:phycobilisome linker polypeptide [Oscillatoria amoena NRMC-F 0135]|uniref:Phycobilisome linker polypeptide n=1 Tax=Geitlerinema calcuttense NRMC-F 0142 TaxID=2922238 RepID=A0ABT7LWT8_9CYAN|nr:phycobilisome linker polypeptide [Geitlerinema calcuttense]MCD8485265.1 phycobilisome linker polypeptide [Desertifilum sp.]MDL5045581.1 phycobilisome linker polypeptide [Oscillatoria amoena NRMC-F 0135]MDL5056468.1 phycobilisome linker polypeptide [Geitlerinema calcuttense NRMC-F 0142]